MSDTILHIHAGLLHIHAGLVVRVLTGRSLSTFIPFFAVAAVEAAKEVLDYLAYGLRLDDTLGDIANTLFWPFVLSAAVRLRPMVLSDHPGGRSERIDGDSDGDGAEISDG